MKSPPRQPPGLDADRDHGEVTLDGEKEGGGFSFFGESQDVEPSGGADATFTELVTVVVTMEAAGSAVSGQVESAVSAMIRWVLNMAMRLQ